MGKTRVHEEFYRVSRRFLHAMVIAVTTMPNRCLSFQVIFTGCETDDTDEPNVHGGAMWARIPITALVADTSYEEWPTEMPTYVTQPWDCMSHDHSVYVLNRATPAPWIAKVDGEFYPAKYYFTVDYTNSEVADDPAQHKQSHVLELLDAGEYTGNIVALPNNRVRVYALRGLRLEKAHQTSDRINILFILNRVTNTFGTPNVFLIIYIRSKKMTKKMVVKTQRPGKDGSWL